MIANKVEDSAVDNTTSEEPISEDSYGIQTDQEDPDGENEL